MIDRPGPIVEVEWVDSTGNGGWHDPDDVKTLWAKVACRSVGYLVGEWDDGIVIVQGAGGWGGYLYSLAIPKGQLVAIRRLAE